MRMVNKAESDLVSSRELARVSGEPYDTIDYWSERGVLLFRRHGRRRLYSLKANLARVKLVRERQDRGHSIEGIRDELRRHSK
jgi:DNA-binding transcriptional MerR regulator